VQLRAGGVEQAGIIGEVRDFDDPRPGIGLQAGGDVLAVLLVLIAAGLPGRVRDRGHQLGDTLAEPPAQDRDGGAPAAVGQGLVEPDLF
jgi:hypothetical protein